MPTTVTVKGQVTLPKAVRDAAGIHPGDKVNVRARPQGGVIIENASPGRVSDDAYLRKLEDMALRKPFKGFTTEELMALTRGEG